MAPVAGRLQSQPSGQPATNLDCGGRAVAATPLSPATGPCEFLGNPRVALSIRHSEFELRPSNSDSPWHLWTPPHVPYVSCTANAIIPPANPNLCGMCNSQIFAIFLQKTGVGWGSPGKNPIKIIITLLILEISAIPLGATSRHFADLLGNRGEIEIRKNGAAEGPGWGQLIPARHLGDIFFILPAGFGSPALRHYLVIGH